MYSDGDTIYPAIMISGANGQLMTDITKKLQERNVIAHAALSGYSTYHTDPTTHLSAQGGVYSLYAYNRDEWDIRDNDRTEELFKGVKPYIYINGASVHSVDDIEADPLHAFNVNVVAPSFIAKQCNKYGTTFINISTNYVFGGNPVSEANNTQLAPRPINMYGVSKAAGEAVVANEAEHYANIRVAGLFGKTGSRAKNNTNFPMMVLDKLNNGEKLEVVNDQIMSIGYTVDIAIALVNLLGDIKNPVVKNRTYHLVNEGTLTWYDLAKFIVELKDFNYKKILKAVTSDERYDGGPKRPKWSALCNNNSPKLPFWQSAVVRFLKEIDEL